MGLWDLSTDDLTDDDLQRTNRVHSETAYARLAIDDVPIDVAHEQRAALEATAHALLAINAQLVLLTRAVERR